MKIAVVGTGISGLGAAWALSRNHDVKVYEAADRLGGHSHTVTVERDGHRIGVDVGFIVYNELNYPNLTRLFDALQVATEKSDMSFSVSLDGGAFEYKGSLPGLVAQPANLAKPGYWRLLRDLRRFYVEAPGLLENTEFPGPSLGDYLARNGYSQDFIKGHLLPMGAAIWSTPPDRMLAFPARSFVAFCENHRLLSYVGRPQWRTVSGGSRRYVARIAEALGGAIRLNAAAVALKRRDEGVVLRDSQGHEDVFDQVVLACHADQALEVLGDSAAPEERSVLSAFRYSANRIVLHGDPGLMPLRRRAWASWNYLSEQPVEALERLSLTYWMNRLQNLDPEMPLFVTLNPDDRRIEGPHYADLTFMHPMYDHAALEAQGRISDIQGRAAVWYCGSYCGYGFHEDGLQAGLTVAAALGSPVPWFDDIEPRSPAAVNAAPKLARQRQPVATPQLVAAE